MLTLLTSPASCTSVSVRVSSFGAAVSFLSCCHFIRSVLHLPIHCLRLYLPFLSSASSSSCQSKQANNFLFNISSLLNCCFGLFLCSLNTSAPATNSFSCILAAARESLPCPFALCPDSAIKLLQPRLSTNWWISCGPQCSDAPSDTRLLFWCHASWHPDLLHNPEE